MRLRAHVYIDGFNLYYGAIKGTSFHWLDLAKMCALLLPGHQIDAIKYFTAIVSARPGDPDKPQRQNIYVRALRSFPNITVTLGQFLSHAVSMPLETPVPGQPRCVRVLKTEEKGTDVNVATHLLHDGHLNRYDLAVLISNDSDLCEPLRIVREELNKTVCIINPRRSHASRELVKYAHFLRQIRPGLLAKCQLPPVLRDARGEIRKPAKW